MKKLAFAALASIFIFAGSPTQARALQPTDSSVSAIVAHADATMQMSEKKMMKKKKMKKSKKMMKKRKMMKEM